MKHCQLHMEQIEKTLPESKDDLHGLLKERSLPRPISKIWEHRRRATFFMKASHS